MLYCNSNVIQRYVKPNDVVNFNDGSVIAIVKETKSDCLILECKIGGVLHSKCGIRFTSGQHHNLPIVAPNDVSDLKEISKLINIDYLCVPFTSNGSDIQKIRETLGEAGKNIKVIAKIDTISGIEGFEDILSQSDGVIIQRNELSWELPSEKLMVAQKWMIQQCNKKAKLVMLQS